MSWHVQNTHKLAKDMSNKYKDIEFAKEQADVIGEAIHLGLHEVDIDIFAKKYLSHENMKAISIGLENLYNWGQREQLTQQDIDMMTNPDFTPDQIKEYFNMVITYVEDRAGQAALWRLEK